MLPVTQAESTILKFTQPLRETETIPFEESFNRILATAMQSQLDFPHWDNSAMDGYAVKFADLASLPVTLEIVTEIPAGAIPTVAVKTGQTARIFTGSLLPEGADTIIMQENTERQGNQVTILPEAYHRHQFVRQQGSFYQAGQPLLPAGIRIQVPEIAVFAATQCVSIPVYRRPKVAIFSTGNELVSPHEPLQPGQIVDSNRYALTAFIQHNGAIPLDLGRVQDSPQALRTTIREAISSADLVLSTGGVSVGDYDYIEQILEELGGKIHIHRVQIKPGKPLTFATFGDSCLYFGLPGNPASALVTCWRFVHSALKKMSGLTQGIQPTFIQATALQELKAGGKRETYLWGNLVLEAGQYHFNLPQGSHNSANLINLTQTDSLAVLPVGVTQIKAGEKVQVMVLQ